MATTPQKNSDNFPQQGRKVLPKMEKRYSIIKGKIILG